RRRHTRSYGDWSSDVCSSDLWDHEIQRVESIEHAAMTRNQAGRVLQPGLTLQERLRHIADLSDDRDREAEQQELPGAEIPSLSIEHELAERERGNHTA